MDIPQAPTPPHLYPQALQLKLYQAFIFSIPILFSIILFLLFYLFYLKRRASTFSPPLQILPSSNQHAQYVSSVCLIGLNKEIKDKLPTVLFDEELKTRDSQCCVCLADFQIKEELLQIPSCKHVFHIECIHHWLHSNSTCPLCRCFVIPFPTTITKSDNPVQHIQNPASQQRQQVSSNSTEQVVVPIEGSSTARAHLIESSNQESVLQIQTRE